MIGKTNATVSGTSPVEKEFHVQVVDYDGTRIVDERYDNGEIFTLPTPPTHTRLTFIDWVSNAPIVNNQITVTKDILIGISYDTVSGLNEFDFDLTRGPLVVTISSSGIKEWGDGTVDTSTYHQYSSPGVYTVKTRGGLITSMFVNSSMGIDCRPYLKSAFLTNNISQNSLTTSFYGCQLLESISICPRITQAPDSSLQYCYNLKSITFPSLSFVGSRFLQLTNVDTLIFNENNNLNIQAYAFDGATFLKDVSFRYIRIVGINNYNKDLKKIELLPMGSVVNMSNGFVLSNNYYLEEVIISAQSTSLPSGCFQYCNSLKKIDLPNTITTIQSSCFSNCISLEKIKLPSSLTTIAANSFNGNYNTIEYDFSDILVVPTLSDINAFININPKCKIYVPDSLYDTWITSTNWVNFAFYIYKASEKPQS